MENFNLFTETLTIQMPDFTPAVREALTEEAGTRALIVEVAAIHEGLTANFNHYSGDELEKAVESWTQPYPKPIIINHNLETDPLGRVMAAEMASEPDGSKYIRLQIAITDPSAIAKVADKRYLTGSVGGKAEESICSVCGKDWSEGSMFQLPCKHERGKTYKGKLAYLERKGLGFHEYSFVNNPADKRSVVKTAESVMHTDEWIDSARIFNLSMDRQEIFAFSEGQMTDVMSSLKKSEAAPLYHQLKGSFLSAIAVDLSNANENEESKVDELENEDILLNVVEQLSEDLSSPAQEESEEENDKDAPSSDESETEDETDEDESQNEGEEPIGEEDEENGEEQEEVLNSDEADSEEADEDSTEEDLEGEEADAQGQERPKTKDKESNFNKPNAKVTKPLKRDVDVTRDSEEGEDSLEENTELMQKISSLELQLNESEEKNTELSEQNARLKTAMKTMLAERVVDQKIALKIIHPDDREGQLTEHVNRTAASLADSLRDLSGITRQNSTMPEEIKPISHSVSDESGSVLDEETEVEEESQDTEDVNEQLFVDVFMGRRTL